MGSLLPKVHNLASICKMYKNSHYFLTRKHNVFIGASNKNDMLKLQKKLYNIPIKLIRFIGA